MTRFYARHIPSGEVYAIEETDDMVSGVSGPLHYSEVRDLDNHDYDAEDADWAQQQLSNSNFAMVAPREVNPDDPGYAGFRPEVY